MDQIAEAESETGTSSETTPLLTVPPAPPQTTADQHENINSSKPRSLISALRDIIITDDDLYNRILTHKLWIITRNFFYILVWLLLIGLVLKVSYTCYFFGSRAKTIMTQSTDININQFLINSFDSNGIEVEINSEIFENYDNLKDNNTKNGWIKITNLIKKFKLSFNNEIQLYGENNINNNENEMIHLIDLSPPEDIIIYLQNKQTSFINLKTIIKPSNDFEKLNRFIMEIVKSLQNDKNSKKNNKNLPIISTKLKTRMGFSIWNLPILGSFPVAIKHQIDVKKELKQIDNLNFNISDIQIITDENEDTIQTTAIFHLYNYIPFQFKVPSLEWDILLKGCNDDDLIKTVQVATSEFETGSREGISINILGLLNQLPNELLNNCDNSSFSPLDGLLESFQNGDNLPIFLRYREPEKTPRLDIPNWLSDLLTSMTIPIPISLSDLKDFFDAGDNLIDDVDISNLGIKLPSQPNERPKISAHVNIRANLPIDISIPVFVDKIKGISDLYYKDEQFASLNMSEWIPTETTYTNNSKVILDFDVNEIPLNITDSLVFQKVISKLANTGNVDINVKAILDSYISTPIGDLTLHDLKVSSGSKIETDIQNIVNSLDVGVQDILLTKSSIDSAKFMVIANVMNPTNLSISLPYFNVFIKYNNETIINVIIKDCEILKGESFIAILQVIFNPKSEHIKSDVIETNGHGTTTDEFIAIEEILSKIISQTDFNITIMTHENSFPVYPDLSKALSGIELTIPFPKYKRDSNHNEENIKSSSLWTIPFLSDSDDDDKKNKNEFIIGTTMHVLSSDVEFILFNPISNSNINAKVIRAVASYEGTEVGYVENTPTLIITPGIYKSPRLAITYAKGIYSDVLRKAINGKLAIDTIAYIVAELGEFKVDLVYQGNEVEADIRW